jgi:hypothetical protein
MRCQTSPFRRLAQIERPFYRNYSGNLIWDSGNSLAEEYIGSCVIFPQRDGHHSFDLEICDPFNPIFRKPYVNCLDFIHTGSVALAQATQILYNAFATPKFTVAMCNSKLKESLYV